MQHGGTDGCRGLADMIFVVFRTTASRAGGSPYRECTLLAFLVSRCGKETMRLPTASATNYAKGYVLAGNGSPEQAAKQACVYDGVPAMWRRLVHRRLLQVLKANIALSVKTHSKP
jgi:hypothetical protein